VIPQVFLPNQVTYKEADQISFRPFLERLGKNYLWGFHGG
jgi:hypothetical protein